MIQKLKTENDFSQYTIKELYDLPKLSGILEFEFKKHSFLMLNLDNDDGIAIKYLYKNYYEKTSLSLWYEMSKMDGVLFDIGAHTGIYTIIGNVANKHNKIISLEPYYMNYARLTSNLKLNNINTQNAMMYALSDTNTNSKIQINTSVMYHTSGGKVSQNGNVAIQTIMLDSIKINKKVVGLKIDTEGHEAKVIKGGLNTIKKNLPDIIMEINQESFNDCKSMLEPLGYKVYYIDEINNKLSLFDVREIDRKSIEGINAFFSIKNIN